MSNYVEFNNKIAFHPGYYIEEIIDDSGLTREDFAIRLDTTPKNLSLLINAEQSLSVDMAMKLSRMLNTSAEYWLNLQMKYDAMIAEMEYEKEYEKEKQIFKNIDYSYFVKYCKLPRHPRKIDEQLSETRSFLKVASLNVLLETDMALNYRKSKKRNTQMNLVKSNIMTQIAINEATKTPPAPKYNRNNLLHVIKEILNKTDNNDFIELTKQQLYTAGVKLIVLPNYPGSKVNGATKKIGNNIMLMLSDRGVHRDILCFTLFHELGHIINNDLGVSYEDEIGEKETKADNFAKEQLIPNKKYNTFIAANDFQLESILSFSNTIKRDPSIVLGRLQRDGYVDYRSQFNKEIYKSYKINYDI